MVDPVESVEPDNDISLEGWTDCQVSPFIDLYFETPYISLSCAQAFTNATTQFYASSFFKSKAQESSGFLQALTPYLGGRPATFQNMMRCSSCTARLRLHLDRYLVIVEREISPLRRFQIACLTRRLVGRSMTTFRCNQFTILLSRGKFLLHSSNRRGIWQIGTNTTCSALQTPSPSTLVRIRYIELGSIKYKLLTADSSRRPNLSAFPYGICQPYC